MSDNELPTDLTLLSVCAILRWFDRDLLRALTEHDEDEIDALLSSDRVASFSETSTAYRLHDTVRASVLAKVRGERSLDELALHTHVFEYFLRRLEQPESGDQRIVHEECCLYHLGELRLLLTERREWHTIAKYIAAVRSMALQQKDHLHQLLLYEGFVAIRTQDYDRGEAVLVALLKEPDLKNDVRMRALNFLAQAYWYQTHYDRALTLYEKVYALASEIKDLLYQGVALSNMS